ncbi:MAG: ABC transporter ATP-binding protein [Acidimicrobiaceae bacterium]|nr:ABC transporter ATP-binding protein [Acidimicrobiaceae bacterium]
MTAAIDIRDVSKMFRVYDQRFTSLKERALHFGRVPYQERWALRDINLTVEEGETFGLVGHNGSGKSTLLKCLSGILRPTTGEIAVRGRVAALLELGSGFHPDMSGRENVFLNASLLGMPRAEVERRFDAIVAFAELEHAIDQQVKYYSSGMYVRLGFAVAVNVDPDILVIDEVLSVGDELFQRKSLDRIKAFQREGRTIVFVTHAADLVRQICDRAAVLDQGEMVALDKPSVAVRAYRERLMIRQEAALAVDEDIPEPGDGSSAPNDGSLAPNDGLSERERRRNLKVRLEKVSFEYPGCESRNYMEPEDPLAIVLDYRTTEPITDVVVGIQIHNERGDLIFGSNTLLLGTEQLCLEERGRIRFNIASVPLGDGSYPVTIGIHSRDEATVYDWAEQRHHFQVMARGRSIGMVALDVTVDDASAPVLLRPVQGGQQ